jgi:hypothetical protein
LMGRKATKQTNKQSMHGLLKSKHIEDKRYKYDDNLMAVLVCYVYATSVSIGLRSWCHVRSVIAAPPRTHARTLVRENVKRC